MPGTEAPWLRDFARPADEPSAPERPERRQSPDGLDEGGLRRRFHLHHHPPLTPSAVLLRYRFTVPVLVGVFLGLALGAAVKGGDLLLTWDHPLQRSIEGTRSSALDRFFHTVSQFGGITFLALASTILVAVVWRRCRSMAFLVIGATLTRPLMEFVLKALVDRDRPDLERLVAGNGPSFPSGHVLAAIAFWGLIPPIVALFTHSRRWWWWSAVTSTTVIGLVAASRVYLGVHWVSDVTGALLLGCLYLLAAQRLLDWHHRRHPCHRHSASVAGVPA